MGSIASPLGADVADPNFWVNAPAGVAADPARALSAGSRRFTRAVDDASGGAESELGALVVERVVTVEGVTSAAAAVSTGGAALTASEALRVAGEAGSARGTSERGAGNAAWWRQINATMSAAATNAAA
jgi:hypothetical protein